MAGRTNQNTPGGAHKMRTKFEILNTILLYGGTEMRLDIHFSGFQDPSHIQLGTDKSV